MIYVLYGVLALLGWIVLYKVTQQVDVRISAHFRRRREDKFLRYVRVLLPKAQIVESITIASSDKDALENIERRLRDASRHL
jgi:hypothetical protein